jgi:nicotinamide mononucleotide transporter
VNDDLSVQLVSAWRSTSWVEITAAVLAVVYLWLAIKQRRSCWAAAFVSSCLYVWVLFGARLYMESVLNAFYAAMAVYGYWQWTRGRDGRGIGRGVGRDVLEAARGNGHEDGHEDDRKNGHGNGRENDHKNGHGNGHGNDHENDHGLRMSRWTAARNANGLLAVVCLSIVSSFFLRRFTPAAWPFMDSMVTWASVLATFLVARKVYENWHWWLIIDSVSFCLCFTRRLYLTMLLFGLYLVMIVIGMREWRRDLQPTAHAAQRI